MKAAHVVNAIKRALGASYNEPEVHFHQSSHPQSPEICFDTTCARPKLTV